MNILYISPYVPDVRARHAGGVCMGKTVETLKKYNQVTVLTFCNDENEKKLLADHPDYEAISTSRAEYVRKVLTRLDMPNMFALRRDRAFRKAVCRIIETKQIDAVHAEYTAMGQYGWIRKKYPGVRFHLVEHDVAIQSYERKYKDSTGIRKLYYGAELRKVKRCEKQYVQGADMVFTLNNKDQALLRERFGLQEVKVINPYYGVDFDREPEKTSKEQAICFVGQMSRSENHEAAERLIRIFKEMEAPGWRLNIIGAGPRPELQAEESDRIHITGFVDDINKEISKNQLAVFPLIHGAGIKLKVLLAFGLGVPVITSAVGAEGIDPAGNVIRLAETDDEFREQIRRLIMDDAEREVLSKASREYVQAHFGWDATEQMLQEVYS